MNPGRARSQAINSLTSRLGFPIVFIVTVTASLLIIIGPPQTQLRVKTPCIISRAWTNERNFLRPLQNDTPDAHRSKEGSAAESCTLQDVEKRPGIIVLTTTNAAFIDFTDNWLESIRRTRACPNITIVAEDDTSFDYYAKKTQTYTGLHVVLTNSGTTTQNAIRIGSVVYTRFVNKRQQYILSYLQKGLEVLFTDVDTFWLRNPFPYLQGDFDVAMERDAPKVYCAGFVYYKPTNGTFRFLRRWIEEMKADKNKKPDQKMMNMLIKRKAIPDLRLRVLDSAKFPNGKLFFNSKWRKNKSDIVVVHNNWIKGHDPKVKRFVDCGMWFKEKEKNSATFCV